MGEVAHHLRNTPNVIGFLGGSEKPVPLRPVSYTHLPVKEGENIEKALKKFKRKFEKTGTVKELRLSLIHISSPDASRLDDRIAQYQGTSGDNSPFDHRDRRPRIRGAQRDHPRSHYQGLCFGRDAMCIRDSF